MPDNLVFAAAILICLIFLEKTKLSIFLLTSQKSFDHSNRNKVFVELSKV